VNKTNIEWTEFTLNPIRAKRDGRVGHYCELISSGCQHCYASRMQARFRMPAFPGGKAGELATSANSALTIDVYLDRDTLHKPETIERPATIFWCSMTDMFGRWVQDGWLVECLLVMLATPWHCHQVLTKRPRRALDFLRRWNDLAGESENPRLASGPAAVRLAHPSGRGQLFADLLESRGLPPRGSAYRAFDWMFGPRWLPQTGVFADCLHFGISAENQATFDDRIAVLQEFPIHTRFVSLEPLLGPIDLGESVNWLKGVIVGGESGPSSRSMEADHVRAIRDQCVAAGVPFTFKQWGGPNKKTTGRVLDGDLWSQYPSRVGVSR
jgi:protein gp37